MLSVLFIGARMRALQIDPEKGSPQPWAQLAFFVCTDALLLQTVMVLVTPLLSGEAVVDKDGNTVHKGGAHILAYVTEFIRYIALLALYGGTVVVIYSVLVIEAPASLGQ